MNCAKPVRHEAVIARDDYYPAPVFIIAARNRPCPTPDRVVSEEQILRSISRDHLVMDRVFVFFDNIPNPVQGPPGGEVLVKGEIVRRTGMDQIVPKAVWQLDAVFPFEAIYYLLTSRSCADFAVPPVAPEFFVRLHVVQSSSPTINHPATSLDRW